jgi:hypothetical protein
MGWTFMLTAIDGDEKRRYTQLVPGETLVAKRDGVTQFVVQLPRDYTVDFKQSTFPVLLRRVYVGAQARPGRVVVSAENHRITVEVSDETVSVLLERE